ncbi:MAG TPA: hypothetical protein VM432_12485 [Bdellovibrionales bacterium]|nr:hypothetical protein [Bdellovibrionales bacterium]
MNLPTNIILTAVFLLIVNPALAETPAASASPAAAAKEQSKEGTRLEELFIWKASEELRLPPEQEQKFADTIRALNSRRRKASESMEQAIQALSGVKTKQEAEKLTAAYKSNLREVHAVQIAELDQLKKIIGAEKLARYLVVKNEITEKLKSLMTAPQAKK